MALGRSKARLARQRLNLQTNRLSAAYRARLGLSWEILTLWCSDRDFEPSTFSDSRAVNALLIQFIQELYDLGASVSLALHAVLAVQTRWRELKGQLRPAWDSIASWKLLLPVSSRTPLPYVLLQALVRFAVFSAVIRDPPSAPIWWAFVPALFAGFFGLLRPKELFESSCSGATRDSQDRGRCLARR